MNNYLRQFALQNDKGGFGRTYVAVADPGETRVDGYYTISNGVVTFEQIPNGRRLPHYPIPVVHLGRLAVDKRLQGNHIGETLLIDALRRSLTVADEIGIYAVELRALTENAKRFYLKYGFVPLEDDDLHLYLPIKTIRKLGI